MDTIKRLNENLSKLDEARKSALGFLSELTDDKSFVETGAFTSGTTFEDGVEALGEGIITGYATVFGIPVYLFVQNFEAMRGSFSSAQATKIKNVMDAAVKNGVPFVSVIDSAGARLDEGAKVLEGYAKIIRLAASMKTKSRTLRLSAARQRGLWTCLQTLRTSLFSARTDTLRLPHLPQSLQKTGKIRRTRKSISEKMRRKIGRCGT